MKTVKMKFDKKNARPRLHKNLTRFNFGLAHTGDDKLECQASGMKITDTRGRLLFSADRKEVLVGAELLRVTGSFPLFFSSLTNFANDNRRRGQ